MTVEVLALTLIYNMRILSSISHIDTVILNDTEVWALTLIYNKWILIFLRTIYYVYRLQGGKMQYIGPLSTKVYQISHNAHNVDFIVCVCWIYIERFLGRTLCQTPCQFRNCNTDVVTIVSWIHITGKNKLDPMSIFTHRRTVNISKLNLS